ncbi:MAG: DUF389 domain-containing protein [Candidatus Moranbacteria bacterium]|nr:DUF389 domain-containing protein [Candidatus Moranbacteria bacterium]
MATCGLLINNIAVLIASMLIAPLLSPVLSLALGIIMNDRKLISRSFYVLLKSIVFSVGVSFILTWLLWTSGGKEYVINSQIDFLTSPSIVYLLIAVIAGATTAFARVKPDINEALPGTAIAITLVPPLATIGIGLAHFKMSLISSALAMFLINIAGIVLAAMVMFSLMNLYTKRTLADRTIEVADEKLKHEKEMCKEKECE